MDPTESPEKVIAPRTAAFAVHVFTACGAACALLALIAAVSADWPKMFVWLGVALVIDGVDGTFARRLHTAELLPRWSGDVLDLVVDILTYVFVPAYAMSTSGLLPQVLAIPLGALAVVALAALTFVPFHVVHPIRILHLRAVTIAALIVWTLLAVIAVADDLTPGFWTVAALCILAVYFVGIGFLRRHHPA